MVSETTPMVLVEGHSTRWPWTSLPCSRCSTHWRPADVDDRIRAAIETLYQALIEAELTSVIGAAPHERTAVIGAAPHERTASRTAQRNGSPPRVLTTTARDLELRIPKLRAGSFFPRCRNGAGGSTRRCSPW